MQGSRRLCPAPIISLGGPPGFTGTITGIASDAGSGSGRTPRPRRAPRPRPLMFKLVVASGIIFLQGGGANPSPTNQIRVGLTAGQAGTQNPWGAKPPTYHYFTHSWGWMAIDSKHEFICPLDGLVFNPSGGPTHPPH